jgi:hypothetical protein
MKKANFFRLTLLLLSIMFVNLMNLNADSPDYEDANILCCGKKYISIEQIALVDKYILVEIEGEVFETPSIHSDANGFYIENVKIADQGNCGHLQWQCPNTKCKKCNSLFYSCCSNCNMHISGKRQCK